MCIIHFHIIFINIMREVRSRSIYIYFRIFYFVLQYELCIEILAGISMYKETEMVSSLTCTAQIACGICSVACPCLLGTCIHTDIHREMLSCGYVYVYIFPL